MPNYKHLQHKTHHWYHFDRGLTQDDQTFLSEKFDFSQEDLESCKRKKTHRPKIKTTSKYSYLIFHIPYRSSHSHKFAITELNVFITRSSLITVESTGDLSALNDFLKKTQDSSSQTENRLQHGPASLFSRLILIVLNRLLEEIDQQGLEIERLNKAVFKSRLAKHFAIKISQLRYDQVVAHNALERQNRIFEQFKGENNPLNHINKNNRTYWNKILDNLHTAQYEVESDMDHLEGLVTTFESLITFQTNEIIKVLTIFSVILLPLTTIAGVYGMNFRYMPFIYNPFGFIIMLTFMLFIVVTMTLVFKYRKWL